jgi:hypothetical protein
MSKTILRLYDRWMKTVRALGAKGWQYDGFRIAYDADLAGSRPAAVI